MRNLPMSSPYWKPRYELSGVDRDQLSRMALHRYDLWRSRRSGRLTQAEAFAAALALTRNDDEQRERECGHDTGAEPRYA